MNVDKIIKNVVRQTLIKEGRRLKDTLDDFSDGKRLFDMVVDIHPMIKDLARPIYGERQQKDNLEKFDMYFKKNRGYFDKIAKKYNKIKQNEGKGPFELFDIVRLLYQYCAYIIRTSINPSNQLDGAERFIKHYPEEVKEWDSNMKEEIEEFAKTTGRNSSNFFKSLIYDKDLDLIDIISNIDFIVELQRKYNLRLLNLFTGR